VGLLAGENDLELVEHTRNGRDINRHGYDLDEIATDIQKPVVQRLLDLMVFRNTHPAFGGDFAVLDSPEDRLILRWTRGGDQAEARIDLNTYDTRIRYTDPSTGKQRERIV
jgi:sucrose phosphorylase